MKYFKNTYTEAEAKKRYRELSDIHHPDKGGNEEIFKEMSNEYQDFLVAFDRGKKSIAVEQTPPSVHPENKPAKPKKPRQKIAISKEYADEIKKDAGNIAKNIVFTGLDSLLEKFFKIG